MLQGSNPQVSGHVHRQDGFVAIDFRGCSSRTISQIYQVFALYCARRLVRRAMLIVGDEDADIHLALRDTLATVALTAGIPVSLKLALVASTPRRSIPHPDVLADLASFGCEVRVFATEQQASQWLFPRTSEPARLGEPGLA